MGYDKGMYKHISCLEGDKSADLKKAFGLEVVRVYLCGLQFRMHPTKCARLYRNPYRNERHVSITPRKDIRNEMVVDVETFAAYRIVTLMCSRLTGFWVSWSVGICHIGDR